MSDKFAVLKCVFFVYVFFTVLACFSAINTALLSLLPGMVFTWIVFVFYILGYFSHEFRAVSQSASRGGVGISGSLVSVAAIICSLYAAYFYTGQGPFDVMRNIANGVSNYNNYQNYFLDNSLSVMSLRKVPAIISLAVLKLSVIYIYTRLFFSRESGVSLRMGVCFSVVSASYIYFSLARGTSFELFEILLLFFFLYKASNNRPFIAYKFPKKAIYFILILLLAIGYYLYNLSSRYSFGEVDVCMVQDMCIDDQSAMYYLSPSLAGLSVKFSLYFSFGFYYISKLFEYYMSLGLDGVVALILPGNYLDLRPAFLCKGTIDCGASWAPSLEKYIYSVGIFGAVIFVFIMGLFSRFLSYGVLAGDVVSCGTLYFIFLLMVSLPVGNFITDSSSNLLSFLIFLSLLLVRKIRFDIK